MSRSFASMPADLKEENRRAVLMAFHDSGRLTTVEVSQKTGISRQTVKKCIEYFLQNNILSFCGKGSSSNIGGKRPELYSLNEDFRMLSILIHHHGIIVNLLNLQYELLDRWDSGWIRIESMDLMWEKIREGSGHVLEGTSGRVDSVCISGPIGITADDRVYVATPFPYWPESDLGRSITEPLKGMFPEARLVKYIGDGPAAGYAIIKQKPELRSDRRILTVYTSFGIGGAVFSKGDLDEGIHKVCGTFGHIIVDPNDEEQCPCGGHGCLERLVRPNRMRERLRARADEYKKSCLADIDFDEMNYQKLFEGSAAGDKLCRKESLYYAGIFGIALRNIILVTDPSYIIFQGDIAFADDAFKERIISCIREFLYIEKDAELNILYDKHPLTEQETTGAAYCLVMDYIKNTERYISIQ